MPLIRIIQIYPEPDRETKIGIWHITEPEAYFAAKVRLPCTVTHPHKRRQHLAARYLLTVLEPEFPLEEILVAVSRRPYLPGNPFLFSLAHCGDYAIAIISKKYRVGIDIEEIGPKVEKVAAKFLAPAELAFLEKERRNSHLTVCWSAKEAVYKWYGLGGIDFRKNMQLQPFSPAPDGMLRCFFDKAPLQRLLRLFYQIDSENNVVVSWLVDDGA